MRERLHIQDGVQALRADSRLIACSKSACTPMESEIVGRTQRAKDKSQVEREARVAVAHMRQKERRENETAEERERRSAADRLQRKQRLGKETANERESIRHVS